MIDDAVAAEARVLVGGEREAMSWPCQLPRRGDAAAH